MSVTTADADLRQVAGATPAAPRRTVPAGAVSVVVHVVFFVLIGWFYRPPTPRGLPEPDRTGGIVLARATAEQVEYLEPQDVAPPASESARSVAEPRDDGPPPEAMAGPPLPELDEAPGAAPSVEIGTAATGAGRVTLPGAPRAGQGHASGSVRLPPRFRGPATGISIFGSGRAEGNSFVFVIDRSKSMGSDGLDALRRAKTELIEALGKLDGRHRFQIIAYHHERVYLDRAGLLRATAENQAKVPAFFDNLAAFGGTNHELALIAALHLKPDVIFLLTDGGSPGLAPSQYDDIVAMARRMRTTVHCIEFGQGDTPSSSFMAKLARDTGGSYRYVGR